MIRFLCAAPAEKINGGAARSRDRDAPIVQDYAGPDPGFRGPEPREGQAVRTAGTTSARAPDPIFHFTPTSASWLNAVESFFSKMTRQRIPLGVFHSIVGLGTLPTPISPKHMLSPTLSTEVIPIKLGRGPVRGECVFP